MVIITINGKKKDREFQNMAQALAFAYQNGECYNAEKIEIAYAAKKEAGKKMLTGSVSITGNLKEGEMLTADISAVKELDEADTIIYEWSRMKETGEKTVIKDAVNKTLILTTDDIGKFIFVTIKATGFEGAIFSECCGTVKAAHEAELFENDVGYSEISTEDTEPSQNVETVEGTE